MLKRINVQPPENFAHFSPSELFRFFFQIGHWTEESFSDEFQTFTRGKLVSTVTINKWKNRDVIPTRYLGPFFKLIESLMEPALAKDWINAFEIVWAHHSTGRPRRKSLTDTTLVSDNIASQHQNWIKALYTERTPTKTISPADIYVPLQYSDVSQTDLNPQNSQDIIDLFSKSDAQKNKPKWAFISGGPKTGKSMGALHIANSLCEMDAYPIYIRGRSLSDIDIDVIVPEQLIADAFSIKSFTKHFRASSYNVAYLVLDGLDEIHHAAQDTGSRLSQLIIDLKSEQKACEAHDKKLCVIAFGRETHVEFILKQIDNQYSKHFSLLTLDGRCQNSDDVYAGILGEDLRQMWWSKFLTTRGYIDDPSLPDFLSTEYDDFYEFGADPHLAHLICHIALTHDGVISGSKLPHEHVNALTYSANKNEIYETLVERLAQDVSHIIDPNQYVLILQHIALAIWQSQNGQSVSLNAVHDSLKNPDLRASYQALNLANASTQTTPNLLITAFYYQLSQDDNSAAKNQIEFTHTSFSEYLVSTLIYECFKRLITAFETQAGFESALKDWTKLSRLGAHSPSLANFCQKQAALEFENYSLHNWDQALEILQSHIRAHHFEAFGIEAINQIQHSSSLLFFIWSTLNLERQKRTGLHFQIPNEDHDFSPEHLKIIHRPNHLSSHAGSMIEPILRDKTFLTSALSGLKLLSVDMSQLSFSMGHIENIICENTNFAMTHWSHVKLTQNTFTKTIFQQALFHQWHVSESEFINCLFQGSRFQGALFSESLLKGTLFTQCHFSDVEFTSSDLENIIFDRCVFTDCYFGNAVQLSSKVKFRHCSFIGMNADLKSIPEDNLENSILQSQKLNVQAQADDNIIESHMDKFLH